MTCRDSKEMLHDYSTERLHDLYGKIPQLHAPELSSSVDQVCQK